MENTGSQKLNIVEIGPGTGTNADSILEFLKNYHLDLYKSCDYTLVEISDFLADQCRSLLSEKHKLLYKSNQIKIVN